MDTKLTLKLDKDIIDKVKIYAVETDQSLSSLVENYFKALVVKKRSTTIKNSKSDTPIVDRLFGILKGYKGDPKEDYINYLNEKYK